MGGVKEYSVSPDAFDDPPVELKAVIENLRTAEPEPELLIAAAAEVPSVADPIKG
jgi:hypothetical protein